MISYCVKFPLNFRDVHRYVEKIQGEFALLSLILFQPDDMGKLIAKVSNGDGGILTAKMSKFAVTIDREKQH